MAGRLPLAAWGPRGALSARQPPPACPRPRGGPRGSGQRAQREPSFLALAWCPDLRGSAGHAGGGDGAGGSDAWRGVAVNRWGAGCRLPEQRAESERRGEASPGPTHRPGRQRTDAGGRSAGQSRHGARLSGACTWEVGSTQDAGPAGGRGRWRQSWRREWGSGDAAVPPPHPPRRCRPPPTPAGRVEGSHPGPSGTRSRQPRPALLGRVCFINTGY